MRTLREIALLAVGGVIAQGAPAINGSTCAYRDPRGNKCALGQMIPDENYSFDFEGSVLVPFSLADDRLTINSNDIDVPIANAAELDPADIPTITFVRQLQAAHDDYAFGRTNRDFVGLFRDASYKVIRETFSDHEADEIIAELDQIQPGVK